MLNPMMDLNVQYLCASHESIMLIAAPLFLTVTGTTAVEPICRTSLLAGGATLT